MLNSARFTLVSTLVLYLLIPATLFSKGPAPVQPQNTVIRDSLSALLLTSRHDTDRCRIGIQIGNTLLKASPDSAILCYQEVLSLAIPNLGRKDPRNTFLKYYAGALRGLGNASYYKGSYETAAGYYLKSLKCVENLKDEKGVLMCNNNLGLVFWKQGNYNMALHHYLKALDISEETGDYECSGAIYNNMGLIQWNQGNYDKAIEYYKKSVLISKKLGNKPGISDAYNNIGLVNWKKRNFDTAVAYYQKSLKIKQELEDAKGISSCYTNIGLVYNDKGSYKQAIDYYLKALAALNDMDDRNEVALIYGNLANTHLTMAETAKGQGRKQHLELAVQFGGKSYSIAREIGAIPLVSAAAADLEKAWKGLGDYQKATDFAEIYIETRDTMFSEEKTKALAEMEFRYAAEKQQLEINRLLKEQSLQEEIIARKDHINRIQRILLFITFAGILAAVIVAIWITRLYFHKKKANRLLETRRLEIEEKNVTKDKLFSIISHDLRNPFNVILGYCEFLVQETSKLPDHIELKEIATTLQSASKQVSNLLTNLLEWSLLQADRLTPKTECINLSELSKEVGLLCSSTARAKEITLKCSIPPDVCCICDKEMVKTVLRNLVSNAVKFTRPGGEVRISATAADGYAHVKVEDNGIGLTREGIEELFRLKRNIPSKGTANEKGTGLGLIICREFVHANKGTISIDSEPGRGTCITFTLPVPGSPCLAGKPVQVAAGQPRKIKILVAEDEDANLYLLNRILTRENYSVVCASNGLEAVEMLKQNPDTSIVLLDLFMPVMNGFEAVREIRQLVPEIPVIAQTGNSYPEDLREIKAAGFTNWVFKPIEKELLLRMISEYAPVSQS